MNPLYKESPTLSANAISLRLPHFLSSQEETLEVQGLRSNWSRKLTQRLKTSENDIIPFLLQEKGNRANKGSSFPQDCERYHLWILLSNFRCFSSWSSGTQIFKKSSIPCRAITCHRSLWINRIFDKRQGLVCFVSRMTLHAAGKEAVFACHAMRVSYPCLASF